MRLDHFFDLIKNLRRCRRDGDEDVEAESKCSTVVKRILLPTPLVLLFSFRRALVSLTLSGLTEPFLEDDLPSKRTTFVGDAYDIATLGDRQTAQPRRLNVVRPEKLEEVVSKNTFVAEPSRFKCPVAGTINRQVGAFVNLAVARDDFVFRPM